VKAIVGKSELRNHMQAKKNAKEEMEGINMNENLEEIRELIDTIDLSPLPSNVLQLLACLTLHQAYLVAAMETKEEEIKDLHRQIRKIKADNFEFTRKCCQNY
jgi:TRAP-type mannitol/chloroaromatic compound transport system substrate-binding protein